jgi:hypothetical protein
MEKFATHILLVFRRRKNVLTIAIQSWYDRFSDGTTLFVFYISFGTQFPGLHPTNSLQVSSHYPEHLLNESSNNGRQSSLRYSLAYHPILHRMAGCWNMLWTLDFPPTLRSLHPSYQGL